MVCKFCGAELPEDVTLCPECGKLQEETACEETEAAVSEETEAAAGEEAAVGEEAGIGMEYVKPTEAPKKKNLLPIVIIAVLAAAVVALAILLVPRLIRERNEAAEAAAAPEAAAAEAAAVDPAEALTLTPEDLPSFTVKKEELTEEVLSRVLATCGDKKLTNRELPFYYWQQFNSFASAYGMYLSYMLDTTVGLDQQMYDDTHTWQQMFLESAADMFHSVAAMYQQAQKDGYTLDAESQAYLDGLEQSMEDGVQAYGYESAEEYLHAIFGPSATMQDYKSYAELTLTAANYLQSRADEIACTDDDVSAYYDANREQYEASGVTKTDSPDVNVRHILIQPEEMNEDGTYTDAAWKTAEEKAKQVQKEWEDGEQTEERFGELAKTYSADGNAAEGGLYEGVYPGQMVPEFNDWCFDPARKPGDVGLVRTDYGYHLIYFSSVGTTVHWFETAKVDFLNEKATEIEETIKENYSYTCDLTGAALVDVLAAEASETEAQTQTENG